MDTTADITTPDTRPSARNDVIAILAMVALVAAVLLIPVTSEFVFTALATAFGFIGHTATAIIHAVGSFIGGLL